MTKTMNKPVSRILALCLVACMMCAFSVTAFAAEVDTSGGEGSTPVNLTTTNEGLQDTDGDGIPDTPGTVTPTKMSVVVPTVLPMAMSEDADATYHKRSEECECGYPRTLYSYHSYSTEKQNYSDTQHKVTKTCSLCGHQEETFESHDLSYGGWDIASETQHHREASCVCGYCGEDYEDHADTNGDGYCDTCSYLMTYFSVTVPANMSLAVANDGYVYSATNAAVVNNSSHAVEITSVTVTAGDGWTIVPYNYNMADEKVDSKLIGFYLNDAMTTQIGTSEKLSLPINWTIDSGDSFALEYDAIVSATSDILTNEQVLTLVFVINWAPR